jgi:hypothetical protein
MACRDREVLGLLGSEVIHTCPEKCIPTRSRPLLFFVHQSSMVFREPSRPLTTKAIGTWLVELTMLVKCL